MPVASEMESCHSPLSAITNAPRGRRLNPRRFRVGGSRAPTFLWAGGTVRGGCGGANWLMAQIGSSEPPCPWSWPHKCHQRVGFSGQLPPIPRKPLPTASVNTAELSELRSRAANDLTAAR
jgi:hypothetical protein